MDEQTALALIQKTPELKAIEPFKSIWLKQTAKRILPQTLQTQTNKEVELRPTPFQTKLPNKSKYITKPNSSIPICYVEYDFQTTQDPTQMAKTLFPETHHDKLTDPFKTQKFHELILVDTQSIQVKHYPDKDDPNEITHSIIQILKVLLSSDFESIKKLIKLSIQFNPQTFTYWDYQLAWYKAFWYKNHSGSHSWMFYFKRNTNYVFPFWFAQWWDHFGLIPEILPPFANQGFQTFYKHASLTNYENRLPQTLIFCSKFSLAWICQWEYAFLQNPKPRPSSLGRIFKVKWWDPFTYTYIEPQQVLEWVNKHQLQAPTTPSKQELQFLSQKSVVQSKLIVALTQEDIVKLL